MVKPYQVLLTLLAVGALCAFTMLVFPKKGVKLTKELSLNFPDFDTFFAADTAKALDVDSLLNSYNEADSTLIKDSLEVYQLKKRHYLLNLQYKKGTAYLPHFYQALQDLKSGKRSKVRILHYGDSQIEGDRITSFVREKLQAEFGGNGPGMLPLMEFVPSMSVVQTQSANWKRYTSFGRNDSTVRHNHFGLAATLSRFTRYNRDTVFTEKEAVTAWVKLAPRPAGYPHAKQFKKLRLHYGFNKTAVAISIKVGDVEVFADSLPAVDGSRVFEFGFESTPKEITLTFTGKDSPDFYAISLEGNSGIVMDNVAMRGSSGTVFTKISHSQLAYQYGKEPISLVLLQYGGNTVPYITSKKSAEEYGKWFGGQIAFLRKMLPNADIILLGPSDMSLKEQTEYVTYPYLADVRDALKKAAFDNGAAFWDIYEVMGGKNSMPSWVAASPPLAGPDYIHFTPSGARKIAELFYKAVHRDYTLFVAEEKARQAALKKQADSTKLKKENPVPVE